MTATDRRDRPTTGMQWTAATVLRIVAAVRRFNADQIGLQKRWQQRYGLGAR